MLYDKTKYNMVTTRNFLLLVAIKNVGGILGLLAKLKG